MTVLGRSTAMVRTATQRAHSDFLMPSRLPAFRQLIVDAKAAGYRFMTHGAFGNLLDTDGIDPAGRYMLLRHDIDRDPATARAMNAILVDEDVSGSFFFRLSTFDAALARVLDHGSEVGYHYEELATLVKRKGRGASTDWNRLLPQAREAFIENVAALRAACGLPFVTAAAHGDFVNRRLGVSNAVVLADPATRERAGIKLEAYDEHLAASVTSRHSDSLMPPHWNGAPPEGSVARRDPVIYVLVHPDNWQASPLFNARDDCIRALEGARYHLRLRGRRPLTLDGSPARS